MLALEGVRVVEVSQFEVGTVCGQQLAWLGADVIKIEKPGQGDSTRAWPAFFATLNSSKRSVTIDLKAAEGRRAFLDLAATADVVVENLAPGKFEALGLAYPVLREVNDRLVFARAKGFGTWGPYASYKAFDMVAQATSGAMFATGEAEGPPMIERFPVADNATGIHLALAIMAALWQRQTTGEGQEVEASLHDTMLSMGRAWFALQRFDSDVRGTTPHYRRNGNRAKTAGDLYPCAGGGRFDQVYVLCMESRPMWRVMLELIGRPDLDVVGADAVEHDRAIDDAVTAWTSRHDKFEAMRMLGEAGVPAGALLTPDEVVADAHTAAREMVVEVEHPVLGPCRILGSPIKLSASVPRISAPPFELGAHTDEVLDELGYSAAQRKAARNDGS